MWFLHCLKILVHVFWSISNTHPIVKQGFFGETNRTITWTTLMKAKANICSCALKTLSLGILHHPILSLGGSFSQIEHLKYIMSRSPCDCIEYLTSHVSWAAFIWNSHMGCQQGASYLCWRVLIRMYTHPAYVEREGNSTDVPRRCMAELAYILLSFWFYIKSLPDFLLRKPRMSKLLR